MSRRQYRRNGTPIGKHKVYALALKPGKETRVFEVIPSGIKNYEDLEGLVMLEEMGGHFGIGHDKVVVTSPGLDLNGFNVGRIDIPGADLSEAALRFVQLPSSDLRGVDLSHADLVAANLMQADLRYADLTGSDLRGTNMYRATIKGTDLTDVLYDSGTTWPNGFAIPTSRDGYRPNRRR
jgi:hypothetical protein